MKDSSGAVLPGVTVEASSPALIEKTRTTVTDGNGAIRSFNCSRASIPSPSHYRDSAPTSARDSSWAGNFVATVTAELKVGTLAESPSRARRLVDVRSLSVQKVVTKEVVDAIPTGRLGINLAALQPVSSSAPAAASVRRTRIR